MSKSSSPRFNPLIRFKSTLNQNVTCFVVSSFEDNYLQEYSELELKIYVLKSDELRIVSFS